MPTLKKTVLRRVKPSAVSSARLAVDVYHTETHLVIRALLAGVKKHDLDISAQGDTVTIRGRFQPPYEHESAMLIRESFSGEFSRTLILPKGVDSEQMRASLSDGVLMIVLPKITLSV